jgi:hypothetical protein
MAKLKKNPPVNLQELIVSSLAMADALAKLLIEKGLITQEEFMGKLSEERTTYQKLSTLRSNEYRRNTYLGSHQLAAADSRGYRPGDAGAVDTREARFH